MFISTDDTSQFSLLSRQNFLFHIFVLQTCGTPTVMLYKGRAVETCFGISLAICIEWSACVELLAGQKFALKVNITAKMRLKKGGQCY